METPFHCSSGAQYIIMYTSGSNLDVLQLKTDLDSRCSNENRGVRRCSGMHRWRLCSRTCYLKRYRSMWYNHINANMM